MKLSGRDIHVLEDALLSAYNLSSLRRMVRIELDHDLEHLVTISTLKQIVFDLIMLAEREDWIKQLIDAAAKAQPDNRQLQQTVAKLLVKLEPPKEQGELPIKSVTPNGLPSTFQPFTSTFNPTDAQVSIRQFSQRRADRERTRAKETRTLEEICRPYASNQHFWLPSAMPPDICRDFTDLYTTSDVTPVLFFDTSPTVKLASDVVGWQDALPTFGEYTTGFVVCKEGLYWGEKSSYVRSQNRSVGWGTYTLSSLDLSNDSEIGFGWTHQNKLLLRKTNPVNDVLVKLFQELWHYAANLMPF